MIQLLLLALCESETFIWSSRGTVRALMPHLPATGTA